MFLDKIASTFLFGLAANTDNLTVGIAYGTKQRRIHWEQNLAIAVITTAITLIALMIGHHIREILPTKLPDLLGGGLLIMFAAWSFYRERTVNRETKSVTVGKPVTILESIILAGSLSINNIGLAVAGGISGVSFSAAAVSIFFLSIIMLSLGQAIGANLIVKLAPQLHATSGNALLALAGGLMIAGY